MLSFLLLKEVLELFTPHLSIDKLFENLNKNQRLFIDFLQGLLVDLKNMPKINEWEKYQHYQIADQNKTTKRRGKNKHKHRHIDSLSAQDKEILQEIQKSIAENQRHTEKFINDLPCRISVLQRCNVEENYIDFLLNITEIKGFVDGMLK